MTAIPFDVFAFTHALIDGGISDKQADTIAQAFTKAIQESNDAVIDKVKRDYKLDEVTTNKDLDARIAQTELKMKEMELRIVTQLSMIQQDMQNTKITNRALLALISLAVGMLIKLVVF